MGKTAATPLFFPLNTPSEPLPERSRRGSLYRVVHIEIRIGKRFLLAVGFGSAAWLAKNNSKNWSRVGNCKLLMKKRGKPKLTPFHTKKPYTKSIIIMKKRTFF